MSLAAINRAASSASVAEDTKNLIIWEMVIMGPLYLGLVPSSERKMCNPARMHDLETLRYVASEWAAMRMYLDL